MVLIYSYLERDNGKVLKVFLFWNKYLPLISIRYNKRRT